MPTKNDFNSLLYPIDINIPKRINSSGKTVPKTTMHVETTYENALKGYPKDGKPVIFLLPGGPGAGLFIYKKHSTELAKYAHLVYWDPRGCGMSAKGKVSTYDMDTYIDDIYALVKILHLKKVIILGTSYGSMCALGYAIKYPKTYSALILGTPVATNNNFNLSRRNLLNWGTREQIKWGLKLLDSKLKNEDEVIRYFKILMPLYSDVAKKNSAAALKMKKGIYNWQALIDGFKKNSYLYTFDYSSQLKKIKVPTLIMTGKRDWMCDVSLVKQVAKGIAKSEFHIFNCGHSFAIDCNKQYIKAVKKFLARIIQ